LQNMDEYKDGLFVGWISISNVVCRPSSRMGQYEKQRIDEMQIQVWCVVVHILTEIE
jgi:hypothetical protein